MADATFVNAAGNELGGSGATGASPALSTTTGNFLFVAVTHYTTGVNITGVTDTAGNSYSKAGTTQGGDANQDNEIWYTPNPITGNASNVATVAFSGSASFRVVAQAQFAWSGASSIAYDAEAAHSFPNGGSTIVPMNSGTVTTTQTDALILGNFVAYDVARGLSNDTGTIMWEAGAGALEDDMVFAYRNTDAAGGYVIGLFVTSIQTDRYSIIAKAFKTNSASINIHSRSALLGVG